MVCIVCGTIGSSMCEGCAEWVTQDPEGVWVHLGPTIENYGLLEDLERLENELTEGGEDD